MGTALIGTTGCGVFMDLTDTTIAALEEVVLKCAKDGSTYLLRTIAEASREVTAIVVMPSTPAKFTYSLQEVDGERREEMARGLLDGIMTDGEVAIGIPE
ncbi:hypothetical protein ACTXOR_08805 [Arthrobacter rhombi]|uniref:hypothetical protein n=1 Tax=Arthrobacter rhombi TaxID=71253 RepID=UPI003FD30F78